MTERWDFFTRAERSREYLAKREVTFDEYWAGQAAKVFTFELPAGLDYREALAAAMDRGMPRGSSRGGCFEIQSDRGIWTHTNERRIDGAPDSKIVFTSWDD